MRAPCPDRDRRGTFIVGGGRLRLWSRFLARHFDLFFASFAGGCCFAVATGPAAGEFSILLYVVLLAASIPVEALFISMTGTTPGKALFATRVRNKDGSRLTFFQAFARALDVWVWGLGLGIPIISLVAMLVSYSRLDENGETGWDARGKHVVQHAEMQASHYLMIAAVVLGFIGFLAYGIYGPES